MSNKKYVDGVLTDMTADEIAARQAVTDALPTTSLAKAIKLLREERLKKLQDTDFHALSDGTMSSQMTAYRVALRDLPSNYTTSDSSALLTDLSNLNWPTKP
jgi:hypothetical protein